MKTEIIDDLNKQIKDISKQISKYHRDIIDTNSYKNIKSSLSCASSALNRAVKQLNELKPIEGQMNISDYLDMEEMEK